MANSDIGSTRDTASVGGLDLLGLRPPCLCRRPVRPDLRRRARADAFGERVEAPSFMALADVSILLLSVALYQLTTDARRDCARGTSFRPRVVKAFRSFAFWLLLVTLVWIVAPVAAVLLAGPRRCAASSNSAFELRDVLTVGIALLPVPAGPHARAARTIDAELRGDRLMAIVVRLDVMLALRKVRSKDLADAIGITEANLSLLKSGKVKGVRFATLEAICEALDCQPGDLLEYDPRETCRTGN